MCYAAVRLRGEQRLYDLLEVFVEGEMPLVRVQLQSTPVGLSCSRVPRTSRRRGLSR